MTISIKSNDRVLVTGKTGSGKSVLVKGQLLDNYERVVFHDVKVENSALPGMTLLNSPEQLFEALKAGYLRILYQPLTTDEDDFDRVCEICYKWGHICLIVDEASFYTSGSVIQPYHKEIMMRGRSRGVGIVNCTQRPKHIHNLLISEAEHFFFFRLTLDDDWKKLVGVVPRNLKDNMYTLEEFQFIYTGVFTEGFVHAPIEFRG